MISLEQNLLRHLHVEIRHSLNQSTTVLLGDNPWSCDCDIQWFKILLRDNIQEPVCAEPPSYRGHKVSQILDDLSVPCEARSQAMDYNYCCQSQQNNTSTFSIVSLTQVTQNNEGVNKNTDLNTRFNIGFIIGITVGLVVILIIIVSVVLVKKAKNTAISTRLG